MTVVALGTASYGLLMIWASIQAYGQNLMRRGAFITMCLGGLFVLGGAGFYGYGWTTGIWLTGVGLYLMSDAAWAVGSQRETGPRLSHHILRAGLAVCILALMVVI